MGPGVGNGLADDLHEGREVAKPFVQGNRDESLLRLPGKAYTFLPCHHGQVIGGILAAHAAHFMLVKA